MLMKDGRSMVREERTARLTILIDPRKKAVFEAICAAEDATPSQIVRGMIRRYIGGRLGKPWTPDGDVGEPSVAARTRNAGRVDAEHDSFNQMHADP